MEKEKNNQNDFHNGIEETNENLFNAQENSAFENNSMSEKKTFSDDCIEDASHIDATEETLTKIGDIGENFSSQCDEDVIYDDDLGKEINENSISKIEEQELSNQGINAIFERDKNDDNVFGVTQSEFDEMSNVIDGIKRKPIKKRKRKTRVRKIVVRTYATILSAVLCIVGIYFGVTILQTVPTQGLEGAELRVDMEDLPHYVGTKGEIDLIKMFPNGSDFRKNGVSIASGILRISGLDDFDLGWKETIDGKVIEKSRSVKVIEDAVNVADWESLVKKVKEEVVVCIQTAYMAVPSLIGIKEKNVPELVLKNDLYGNGCKLNVFEIVCCRTKNSGGKLTAPYLQGNGPGGGYSAFIIEPKEDESQITMRDLHIIGNDMSTAEGGNLAGLSDVIIEKRGLKLFSGYGHLISISGDNKADDTGQKGLKSNFKLQHCILENSHQIIHIRHSNVDLVGNIIRNASDSTISVATYANEKSTINSKNNVLANSLTGGLVFYCFDSNINEANEEESWNVLHIEQNSFLDIYNWKEQDGLAFMPETESGAEVANPVAKSEIPKSKYDKLKADIDGKKYIHFAIIKLKTGGGLSKNGSYVENYEQIGYQTTRDKGYPNGFPLPNIAAAIIKDIDVWGYYERSNLDVSPTAILDQKTVEKLYKELINGRAVA